MIKASHMSTKDFGNQRGNNYILSPLALVAVCYHPRVL